jgi:hypothetical protein
MSSSGWLWNLFGWAALPLVAILLVVFLYRKFIAEFPVFFSYLLVTEVVGVVRIIGSAAPLQKYFYIYWISDIAYSFFALLATCELFAKHLFPGFSKTRFYRYLFMIAAVVILLSSIALAMTSGRARVLVSIIYAYNLVRSAILLFFVALMILMGRHWTRLQFGIAAGFALDVSTSLAALGIWSRTPSWNELIGRISAVAYDIACLIWLYCFWTAEKTPLSSPPILTQETLHEAQKWQTALKDFISPGKR